MTGADGNGKRVLRVLVVEDEPDVRLLLTTYLNLDDRFEVCGEAVSGDEALRLVDRNRFDAIVLDLQLPVVDGLTVLPQMRSRLPTVGIVVYSAHVASVLTERTVLRLGADAVAPKWMALSELKESIVGAVASRRAGSVPHLT